MNYYFPVILVVGANTLYHICSKSVPGQLNAFASLVITYLVGAAFALALFFATSPTKDFVGQLKETNWAPFALGLAIVGLEVGFIFLYRAGWEISLGSLVCNIALAVVLIAVGLIFFKEHIGMNQIIGIVLCIGGLIFINRAS